MTALLALPILLASAGRISAPPDLRVCVANEARLDRFTEREVQREMSALFRAGNVAAVIRSCSDALLEGEARIELRRAPGDEHPPDAIGAARIGAGRVTGELTVFVDPVRRLLPSDLPSVVGAAIARVAAHELVHYYAQSTQHERCGLMTETFTGARLMAGSRSFVPRIAR